MSRRLSARSVVRGGGARSQPAPRTQAAQAQAAPRPAVTADNVWQWIDRLQGEPQNWRELRFDLHNDVPLAALKSLLSTLESWPQLERLEVAVIAQAPHAQAVAFRYALAGSLFGLSRSLGLRQHLRCQAEWTEHDELEWREFFQDLDCRVIPTPEQPELDDNARARVRAMAMFACKHGEGPLLKALKTLSPTLFLRFTGDLPTRAQVALLLKRKIPVHIEYLIDHPDKLHRVCRLVRHGRLHLDLVYLKFKMHLNQAASGWLLSCLLQARQMKALTLHVLRGIDIDWPSALPPLPQAAAKLQSLTLNLLMFERCPALAAQCIAAWSPSVLSLQFHRRFEWALLSSAGFGEAMARVEALNVRVEDFATHGDEMFAELMGHLDHVLSRAGRLLSLRLTVACTLAREAPLWSDWVAMAERHFPLQHLSVSVRNTVHNIPANTQCWRWSSRPLLKRLHKAYANAAGTAFLVNHISLPHDVGKHCVEERRFLSLHDCFVLAQVSRRVRQAALKERRRIQRDVLLELASYGLLDTERLQVLMGSALHWAPDRELLQDLLLTLQAQGMAEDQQALVQGLLRSEPLRLGAV